MPGKDPQAIKEYHKQYYLANREKILGKVRKYNLANHKKKVEYDKKYYLANREKKFECTKQYRLANPEKKARYNRKWYLANPEKRRATIQRYRARKRCLESTLTVKEWRKIVDDHFGRCHYCGIKSDNLTQDHKIPLSSGGEYTKENIVPACRSCNSSKGAKDYKKFVKESKNRLQQDLFLLGGNECPAKLFMIKL